jgi:hypothetical protein
MRSLQAKAAGMWLKPLKSAESVQNSGYFNEK